VAAAGAARELGGCGELAEASDVRECSSAVDLNCFTQTCHCPPPPTTAQRLNPSAQVLETTNSELDVRHILNTGLFSMEKVCARGRKESYPRAVRHVLPEKR